MTIYFQEFTGVYLDGPLHDQNVPDQVRALSQVGTKKISGGGWTILELFEPYRNHYLSSRAQSEKESVFTRGQN